MYFAVDQNTLKLQHSTIILHLVFIYFVEKAECTQESGDLTLNTIKVNLMNQYKEQLEFVKQFTREQ